MTVKELDEDQSTRITQDKKAYVKEVKLGNTSSPANKLKKNIAANHKTAFANAVKSSSPDKN